MFTHQRPRSLWPSILLIIAALIALSAMIYKFAQGNQWFGERSVAPSLRGGVADKAIHQHTQSQTRYGLLRPAASQ